MLAIRLEMFGFFVTVKFVFVFKFSSLAHNQHLPGESSFWLIFKINVDSFTLPSNYDIFKIKNQVLLHSVYKTPYND